MRRERLAATMVHASDRRRPSWGKLLREFPAAVRLLASQLRSPPFARDSGSGAAVIVIPAFLANDLPTRHLRRTLAACGYSAYGWGQGINFGARAGKFSRLLARIDGISARTGQKVALIGWSLGGLYARELAKRRPDKVSMVITLGTPFSNDLRRNNAWKLYELINDHDVDHPPIEIEPAAKPPVRTIAIWSRGDGIVAPSSASGADGDADERITLECPHNELVSDADALRAIVDTLDGARAAAGPKRRTKADPERALVS